MGSGGPQFTAFDIGTLDVTDYSTYMVLHDQVADPTGGEVTATLNFDQPLEAVPANVTSLHGLREYVPTSSAQFQIPVGAPLEETGGLTDFDPATRAGVYELTSVVLTDAAGATTTYTPADLAADGFATSLTVVADSTPPTLTAASIASTAVAPGAAVVFAATATDAGSTIGLVALDVTLDRPPTSHGQLGATTAAFETQASESGATPGYIEAGQQGTTAFSSDTPGRYDISTLTATDYAGNVATYTAAELRAMGEQTSFVVATPEAVSGTLQAPSGFFAFTGQTGGDRLVVGGNVGDYTFSQVQAAGDGMQVGDDILTAKNGGAIYFLDNIATVQFQNGQYLAIKDLPAYIARDDTLGATSGPTMLYQEKSAGYEGFASAGGTTDVTLNGNVGDYTLRAFHGEIDPAGTAIQGVELVADNGSGALLIDSGVSTVHFQDGQYLSYQDLAHYIAADPSPATGDLHVLADGLPLANPGGSSYAPLVSGTGDADELLLSGNAQDYHVERDASGDFVLDGVANSVTVTQSIATVQFQNGQYLALKDLPAYVAGDATFTAGTSQNDILIAGLSGDQYIVGGAGADDAYIHGNVQDYKLQAVDIAATSSHPAVDGYELVADNGSGNLYIDQSTETIHFQNGQYLAFHDLPAYVDPFHG